MPQPIALPNNLNNFCKKVYNDAKAAGFQSLSLSFMPSKADTWSGSVIFSFIAADAAAVPPVLESAAVSSNVQVSVTLV